MPRIAYVFFAFLVVTFTAAVTSSCSGTSGDVETTTSYVRVYTDPATGCQYLTKFDARTGLVPRLDRHGNPICNIEAKE